MINDALQLCNVTKDFGEKKPTEEKPGEKLE